MRKALSLLLTLTFAVVSLSAADKPAKVPKGWKRIFDGKTLNGWKTNENPDSWTVQDGALVAKGPRSHLFYMDQEFEDLEFKATIKLAPNSNSGMYIRTAFGPGFPKGYETQVNNSAKDPKRTGSLYNFVDVREQLVPDDTWWTQHVIAQGNHIIVKVNDKVVVDYVDEKNTYTKGHVVFQQHDPNSSVIIKDVMVKALPKK